MTPLSLTEIITATNGTLLCGDSNNTITEIATDTRALLPNSLFVPLVGERFDAHNFITEALQGDCVASLSARKDVRADKPIIYVEDTKKALQDIARYLRKKYPCPLFAITGSVGKTTVKELTGAVLGTKFSVLKTAGNFNNEIGLPLTLSRLEEGHQAAIIEMGMSDFGEIDTLASICKPDFGIVTGIGLSHIEHLGSQENIYRAKAELFPHIKPEGTVIINGEDPLLFAHKDEIKRNTLLIGFKPSFDIFAKDVVATSDRVSFTLCYKEKEAKATLSFPGEHNVINALLASGAGLLMGLSLEEIARGLSGYVPKDRRLQFMDIGGITFINDCYNAAPASMEAGLRVLSKQPGRKIAILGDMKELGEYRINAHKQLGDFAAHIGTEALFTFGEDAKYIALAAKNAGMAEDCVFSYTEIEPLTTSLQAFLKPGDVVFVKGSRAMKLERVIDYMKNL